MEHHFHEKLDEFKQTILKMAVLVEESIYRAIESLRELDSSKAQMVIENDKRIDTFENEIEEMGIELLALERLFAVDLRFVTTGMKINAELERIADLSVNIAQRVLELCEHKPLLKPLIDIPRLSENARMMVKDAITAFVNHDEELAKKVIFADTTSDKYRNEVQRELIYDYMSKDGSCAPKAVPLLLIARHLERISDHATYIAEDIIYMVRAKVVKHHPEKLYNNDVEENEDA